jgi:hypothetical protein
MTLLERLETMREHLLHPHQDDALVKRRHEGKHEDHDLTISTYRQDPSIWM